MADKAIFNQPEDNNPALTNRLAHGNETTSSSTISFSGLISWLEGKLGFFKVSSNLSEGNASLIRSNISTYSKAEIDSKDGLKADKTNVLELDNTDTYVPSSDYHPATVKYVKDNCNLLALGWVDSLPSFAYGKYKGALSITGTQTALGVYRITHNYGNTNYVVFGQIYPPEAGQTNLQMNAIVITNNYFDIYIAQGNIAANGACWFKMESTL